MEPSDEGVMEVYVEAGSRVELNCSIQGTTNISWSRPQGSISRNSERKGVSDFPFILIFNFLIFNFCRRGWFFWEQRRRMPASITVQEISPWGSSSLPLAVELYRWTGHHAILIFCAFKEKAFVIIKV